MSVSTTAPQLFSGDLRPFPGIPVEWSASKRALAEDVLSHVRAAFPDMLGEIEPGADIEDFWEDACRVSAAWLASGGKLKAKQPGNWSKDHMARRLGPVTWAEEGGPHGTDTLIGHPIVQQYGGRSMFRGSLGGDPRTDIITWLAARHRDHGVKRGVVKTTARKNGIWSIELDSHPAVVAERLADAMEWSYVRLEGVPDALFAQDALELQYEYRLFVVDGEVVSGAGCLEEFTPLDGKPGELFDTRVRRVRGHLDQGEPSPVEDRVDIVEHLLVFGSRVAKEHGGTVVIDVAMDAAAGSPHGAPVVIELNSMSNSGLYASDPWYVNLTLIKARDRGYTI